METARVSLRPDILEFDADGEVGVSIAVEIRRLVTAAHDVGIAGSSGRRSADRPADDRGDDDDGCQSTEHGDHSPSTVTPRNGDVVATVHRPSRSPNRIATAVRALRPEAGSGVALTRPGRSRRVVQVGA